MKIRIAINGLGRIGRCVLRAIFEYKMQDIEVVAINGPAEIDQHIHLLKYDSVHGVFRSKVEKGIGDEIIIDGTKIPLLRKKSIEDINWKQFNVDIVLECTGKFTSFEDLKKHIASGAKKVILSAPAKEPNVKTIVVGVNEDKLSSGDEIISVGSCTTNCLAPIAKILDEKFGIEKGFMTTIHSYTGDQNNIDGSHKDLRRARACALSMIPTSTGAAKALGLVLPNLTGKLDGSAIRVPTPNVSAVDLCFLSKQNVTKEDVNQAILEASNEKLFGIIKFETEPLVSIDFNHTKESSIFDSLETKVTGQNFVRVLSWYDNEWGFSCRMIDLARIFSKK